MMKNWITYLILLLICVIIGLSFYFTIKHKNAEIEFLNKQVEYYKQAANPSGEIIDSLFYNIEYRDSIIWDIKTKYIEDVEIVKSMPDSAAIILFNELVWTE